MEDEEEEGEIRDDLNINPEEDEIDYAGMDTS